MAGCLSKWLSLQRVNSSFYKMKIKKYKTKQTLLNQRSESGLKMDLRSIHEIEHGQLLSAHDTELIWGWATPAGKVRAKRRANLITAGAQLRPGVSVLEIGCGTGLFTEMFAESGTQLVAVDISPDLLRKARTRNLPSDRVHFIEKRFEDCDIDDPFDAIIGSSILHHLALNDALPQIYKLLKPGGVISFAEPNMLNPYVFILKKFPQWFPYESPDETAFLHWRLKNDLKNFGFEKIEITPFDWLYPFTPAPMINFVKSLGAFLEKTPLLRHVAGSLYINARRPKD